MSAADLLYVGKCYIRSNHRLVSVDYTNTFPHVNKMCKTYKTSWQKHGKSLNIKL